VSQIIFDNIDDNCIKNGRKERYMIESVYIKYILLINEKGLILYQMIIDMNY
jgi:hypothetical protein